MAEGVADNTVNNIGLIILFLVIAAAAWYLIRMLTQGNLIG